MHFHTILLAVLIGIVVLCAGLAIGQMWFSFLVWDIFLKAVATLVILALVIGLVMVLKSDLGRNKDLKDNNYLD